MISTQQNTKQAKENAPSRQNSQDADLCARFMGGDDTAFMELFDRHTHRLYLYCLKFVHDRVLAEDLVHDIWERFIKLREKDPAPLQNPAGYLVRMARNLCLNHIRDTKKFSGLEDVPEQELPHTDIKELSHHEELVLMALPRLPVSQREVLILNAYSGYRFDEIAEILGESVGAIRTRAWRARNQLGRIISAFIELDENTDSDNYQSGGSDENDSEECI